MTPYSSSTPYCTATQLFSYHDSLQCGDMLRNGGDPRPSYMAMLDTTTEAGSNLARILKSGAGKIEAVCLVGKRYRPTDLEQLLQSNTVGTETLIKLNADVTFWQLCQRRQPNAADPRNVPGAIEVVEFFKALSAGEAIFGFVESAEAGLPHVQQGNPQALLTGNVVGRAVRLFPNYGANRLTGNQG